MSQVLPASAFGRLVITTVDAPALRAVLALSTVAVSGSAADLLVGTLDDARLSANVPLKVAGKIQAADLPDIAITDYLGSVASQAAMLALVGQKGDFCTRSDLGVNFIITGPDPTQLASWTQLTYPTSPVTSVAGRTGAIVLSTADVTGLGYFATGTNAANLTGTVADARLSANVPLLNAASNVFTGFVRIGTGTDGRLVLGDPAAAHHVELVATATELTIQSYGSLPILVNPGGGGSVTFSTPVTCTNSFTITGTTFSIGPGSALAFNADGASDATIQSFASRPLSLNAAGNAVKVGPGGLQVAGPHSSAPVTPAQITADQANYNPGSARIYRLSSDAARAISGLSISQLSGQLIRIVNVGANNITLSHQGAGSVAGNRFLCKGAADIVLAADEEAQGWYDGTTQRFRIAKV